MEISYITSDKLSEYKKYKKDTGLFCTVCSKPMFKNYVYCKTCLVRLLLNAFEKRIKIGKVGLSVINYQQHLHRKFFNCNAPVKYRGDVTNRIRNQIKKETINKAVIKLDKLLTEEYYYYRGKKRKKTEYIIQRYKNISNVRNITKRLLYNTVLYFIDYFILDSKHYNNLAHFQASVTNNIFINIDNTNIRHKIKIKHTVKDRCIDNGFMYLPYVYEQLVKIVKPILVEL